VLNPHSGDFVLNTLAKTTCKLSGRDRTMSLIKEFETHVTEDDRFSIATVDSYMGYAVSAFNKKVNSLQAYNRSLIERDVMQE
jgi:hypothetical protein